MSGTNRIDTFHLLINGQEKQVDIHWQKNNFLIDGKTSVKAISIKNSAITATIDNEPGCGWLVQAGARMFVASNSQHFEVSARDLLDRNELGAAGSNVVKAPMPGKVIALNVKPGEDVATGEVLLVLEAMKMEHSLTATI